MLTSQCYSDLILIVGSTKFAVHKFMLAALSATFFRLLTTDISDMGGRSSSESSMVIQYEYLNQLKENFVKNVNVGAQSKSYHIKNLG